MNDEVPHDVGYVLGNGPSRDRSKTEYDESSGELNKTFSCVDEFYDDTVEVELEGDTEDENALFDEEYYGGRTNFTVEVLDDVSGEAESSFIEEAISEEYDEIFHSATKKPSSLLN